MDLKRFSSLSDVAKLDYIVIKLENARGLMEIIYSNLVKFDPNSLENRKINIDELSKELEYLGDCFVSYGIATEDGRSEEIFEDLHIKLDRLNEIAGIFNKSSLH